ncbi:MAG: hypothetical protein Q8904_01245 [Bacteroidota bacterium]|nr:hypothetical protein [Bacteroidota bacterium]
MKNIDDKLDNLITNIRRQKPVLHDAAMLTDAIMKETMNIKRTSKSTVFLWIRAISSSAAILLLSLLLFQLNGAEPITSSDYSRQLIENKIGIDSLCLQNRGNKEVNLMQIYLCHLQSNSLKNNRLKSYTQSITN